MKTPKQVSVFAKEYEDTYIANVQLRAAVLELRKQLDQAKYGFDINELQPEYGEKIEVYNMALHRWQTAYRSKNAYRDYYVPYDPTCTIGAEQVSHWRPFYEPELVTV